MSENLFCLWSFYYRLWRASQCNYRGRCVCMYGKVSCYTKYMPRCPHDTALPFSTQSVHGSCFLWSWHHYHTYMCLMILLGPFWSVTSLWSFRTRILCTITMYVVLVYTECCESGNLNSVLPIMSIFSYFLLYQHLIVTLTSQIHFSREEKIGCV